MKDVLKKYWGIIFAAALFVPYALGIWEDHGYAVVVAAAVALLLIVILGRQVKVTFWWEGLWKRKKKNE